MPRDANESRTDALKSVIATLLSDDHRQTCDDIVDKAATSYRDFGLGLRFHRMHAESLTALRRAQDDMPWSFLLSYQVAVQELRCGQLKDAKQSALQAWDRVSRALERKGEDEYLIRRKSDIARLLGEICSEGGQDDEGASWWKESVRLAADKADAVVDVSRRLVGRGRTDLAREVLLEHPDLIQEDARIARELKGIERVNVEEESTTATNERLPTRVVILVDVANFERLRRTGSLASPLPYEAIPQTVAPGADVLAVDAFVPDIPGIMDELGESLKQLGCTVRLIRSRWQGGVLKADADAAITAWMMLHIARCQPKEVWIVTSDEDFAEAVEPAHELQPGVMVCFAGINQNGHSELARRGDKWVSLQSGQADVARTLALVNRLG
jgi:hypothetical protein